MCAATLPKSLLVSATFPAREWIDRRSLGELHFTRVEIVLVATSVMLLTGAALVEAFG